MEKEEKKKNGEGACALFVVVNVVRFPFPLRRHSIFQIWWHTVQPDQMRMSSSAEISVGVVTSAEQVVAVFFGGKEPTLGLKANEQFVGQHAVKEESGRQILNDVLK